MSAEYSVTSRFLFIVAQEKFGYAVPELESIGKCCEIDLSGRIAAGLGSKNLLSNDESSSPILIIESLCEEQVRQLLARSVLVKDAYELWGMGTTLASLKESLKNYPSHLKEKWLAAESFAVRVKGVGKKLSQPQQISKIDSLEDIIPFQGKVALKNPFVEIGLIEDYSERTKGQPPKEPLCSYVGRYICSGQRKLIGQYSLKTRKFIGNTSMDAMLGMIMANMACVRSNTLTCDPFVGTGSLLISAAHFGSYVIGADINYNILHAKGKSSRRGAGWRQKDETIRHSLQDYGREAYFVDALVADAANHPWRLNATEVFDAIITDPPYGIREACSRVGSKNGDATVPDLAPGQVHFPEQKAYHLDDVFKDLLTFAVRSLVVGGRLVYWLPVYKHDYSPDVIPAHPFLKLLYNCEQALNGHSTRRLIVMEKLKVTKDCNFLVGDNQAFINSSIFCGHNAFRDKYFKP